MNTLWIFLGGGIGSVARFWLSSTVLRATSGVFPAGTMAVNLLGCFVIGSLWALTERVPAAPAFRNFMFVGVLGGFTTFSSFGLETLNLMRAGEWRFALVNILVSNVAGIGLAVLGFMIFRALFR
ncbi:MAG: fluoride efflux transporter CrcB [Candidatus Omnitrophica bacterium]|nr:fluoride efflux transporter CrcB [Candidatus Omnitrophota bacterium]